MSRGARGGGNFVGRYGLGLLAVLIFIAFAVALPDTYPTVTNIRAIAVNQAIPAIVAIAISIPLVTGHIDLSVGYLIGFAHVVVMWMLVNTGLPWPLVGLIVLLIALVLGVINGILVEFVHIDSFIATLGTGSVMYALTGWVSGGARIVPGPGGLPTSFTGMANSDVFGVPYTMFYLFGIGVVLWLCLEHLPIGRHLYVVGANPLAAELVGIKARRMTIYAFAACSVVTTFAGILLAGQQQLGNPSVGLDYLLPALVGALLGSTTIKPGRANAAGTLVAVAIIAIGLSGLQQLGAQFWVTPMFNGLTLLAAVGLAGFAVRRRQKARVVVGGEGEPGQAGAGGSAALPTARASAMSKPTTGGGESGVDESVPSGDRPSDS